MSNSHFALPDEMNSMACPPDAYLRTYKRFLTERTGAPAMLYPGVPRVQHIVDCARCQARIDAIERQEFATKKNDALRALTSAEPMPHLAALTLLFEMVLPKQALFVHEHIDGPEFAAIIEWLTASDVGPDELIERAFFLRGVLLSYASSDVCRRMREALQRRASTERIGRTLTRKGSLGSAVMESFFGGRIQDEVQAYRAIARQEQGSREQAGHWDHAAKRLTDIAMSTPVFERDSMSALAAERLDSGRSNSVARMQRWAAAGALAAAAAVAIVIAPREKGEGPSSRADNGSGLREKNDVRVEGALNAAGDDDEGVVRRGASDGQSLRGASFMTLRHRGGAVQPMNPRDRIRSDDILSFSVTMPAPAPVNVWLIEPHKGVSRLLPESQPADETGESALATSWAVQGPCQDLWIVVGIGAGSSIETQTALERLEKGALEGDEWVPRNSLARHVRCE